MSIIIKSLKNTKKISKDFSKTLKALVKEKPDLRIGMEWKDEFYSILDNFKKIKKIDFGRVSFFALSVYKDDKQSSSFDSEIKEKFISETNAKLSNCEDMNSLKLSLYKSNRINDLFLFNDRDGVDLLIFFIDSKGNFIFNDLDSSFSYLNLSNNGNDIISIGLKSILKSKKIICFSIDESSKDVVFRLNKKQIEKDDIISYLHLHNDITLYTLHSIIQKREINDEPISQNISEFKEMLYSENNDHNLDIEIESDEDYDDSEYQEELNYENKTEELDSEDNSLELDDDFSSENEDDNSNENTAEDYQQEDEELNLFDEDVLSENNEVENLSNENYNDDHFEENDLNDSLYEDNNQIQLDDFKERDLDDFELNILPDNEEDLIKYIEIKQATLKQIENIILENKLSELKNKTYEKFELLNKLKEINNLNDKHEILEKIQPILNENPTLLSENFKNINQKNPYKFSYIPGIRPTPMIMVWHEKNKSFFKDLQKEMLISFDVGWKPIWTDNYMHLWNDGAYIIYNPDNYEIITFVYRSEDRLLFLLRYINKPLFFLFSSENDFSLLSSFVSESTEEMMLESLYD